MDNQINSVITFNLKSYEGLIKLIKTDWCFALCKDDMLNSIKWICWWISEHYTSMQQIHPRNEEAHSINDILGLSH